MSENEFKIIIYFQKGKFTKEKLIEILNYPIQNGISFRSDSKESNESNSKYIESYVKMLKRGINYAHYSRFDFGINFGTDVESIEIDFHRDQLNPSIQLAGENSFSALRGTYSLNEIYEQADFLIDFSKFIWESLGGGYYAVGDWEEVFHILYRQKIPLEKALNHFWIAIVPNNLTIPEKYSYGITKDGKPLDEIPWQRKEEITGGTLLVSSRLPWWAINESPKRNNWKELEVQWKKLEAKR